MRTSFCLSLHAVLKLYLVRALGAHVYFLFSGAGTKRGARVRGDVSLRQHAKLDPIQEVLWMLELMFIIMPSI